jgi:hypothetical protein
VLDQIAASADQFDALVDLLEDDEPTQGGA